MKIDIFNTNKRYGVIYADPPWQYNDRGSNGACEKHYSTMKLDFNGSRLTENGNVDRNGELDFTQIPEFRNRLYKYNR